MSLASSDASRANMVLTQASPNPESDAEEELSCEDATQDGCTSIVVSGNHSAEPVYLESVKEFWKSLSIPFSLVQDIVLLKRRSDTLDIHRKFSKTSNESEVLVLDRIADARHRARQFAAYTCVVEYLFAEPRIDRHFYYQKILAAAAAAPAEAPIRLIDVGCCVGTDIRKLVVDGYPACNITAMDKESRFFDLGMQMYNQSLTDGLRLSLIKGDLLDPRFSERFSHLLGVFDHVHSANVVHLFDIDNQIIFLRNMTSLVKPGGIVWGRQVGESDDSPTKGVKIEGKGHRCTPQEFMQLLHRATGWDSVFATYVARLVSYDELRLKQDYKNLSLEWLVKR